MKQAVNPFLPLDTYIPDGEPHVFGDRVYLFGSHDAEDGDTFCMLGYEIFSAPVDDLGNWSSKGINYEAKQDPLYSETLPYMYAPDCVRGNDGRYYLYYCMAGWRGKGCYSNPVSVAVCDTPDGKYEYLGVVRNPDGTPMTRYACFDPAVINDNGTIRLYYGTSAPWIEWMPIKALRIPAMAATFGRTKEQLRAVPEGITGSYHVTLSDDMLTATSSPVRIDNSISGSDYKKHRFFEGSSIRKVGEKYYFIYSSVNNHELCYAVSERPDGGFRYGGTIVSNGDIFLNGRKPKDRINSTGTNHGSIERVNGQWYVFYHRVTHNSDYSRQACAEKITILPDGFIPQVEITSCGLNGRPLMPGRYPAVICCNLTNGKMLHTGNSKKKSAQPHVMSGSGERFIASVSDGTRIGYKYFTFNDSYTLTVRSRGEGGGLLLVSTAPEGPALAELSMQGSTAWTEQSCTLPPLHGTLPLHLRYQGKGTVELLEIELTQTEGL